MNDEEIIAGQLVDPPNGWRYGFPKIYNPKPNETLKQWFIRMGYPENRVHFAVDYPGVTR